MKKGIDSLGICLLNSYVNPAHEQMIKRIANEKYPNLFVSISSELIPMIKEYERTSETVINAYIKPVVAKYMYALQETLTDLSVRAPLLIMQSSGGMMSINICAEKPIYIIECGPAAGVVGSRYIAKKLEIPNIPSKAGWKPFSRAIYNNTIHEHIANSKNERDSAPDPTNSFIL